MAKTAIETLVESVKEGVERIEKQNTRIFEKIDAQAEKIAECQTTIKGVQTRVSIMEKNTVPASAWVGVLKNLALLLGAMAAAVSSVYFTR